MLIILLQTKNKNKTPKTNKQTKNKKQNKKKKEKKDRQQTTMEPIPLCLSAWQQKKMQIYRGIAILQPSNGNVNSIINFQPPVI